nr:hypothetical protein [Tanacetum cinerariifolium]
ISYLLQNFIFCFCFAGVLKNMKNKIECKPLTMRSSNQRRPYVIDPIV